MLVAGDLVAYIVSLILTLTIRYGELPSRAFLAIHVPSFSILFILFLIVSYSGGLYDKQSYFMRGGFEGLLIKVQIVNAVLGVAFFYFAPVFIAPKANLFIYFVISTLLLIVWRRIMFPVFSTTRSQAALLLGSGPDIEDLFEEVDKNQSYGITFKEKIIPAATIEETIKIIDRTVKDEDIQIIIADLHNQIIESTMPFLYSLIFSGVQIIDASKFYESIFDRIPVSLVGEKWLVENAASSLGSRRVYDSLKRLMDIVVAGILGIISLIAYPFIFIAIKMEDRGKIFIKQERVGKNGKLFRMMKFRSMSADDGGVYNIDTGKTKLKVTKVGKFTRLTRIDELPQLWSVIKGDQSLIGPRPELPALVKVYEEKVPYYNVRHLIKPGLSGWAQIYHRAHPHHAVAVDDTREKLSYDLYYIKNRSLGLDIRIALQTIRALLSRQGV